MAGVVDEEIVGLRQGPLNVVEGTDHLGPRRVGQQSNAEAIVTSQEIGHGSGVGHRRPERPERAIRLVADDERMILAELRPRSRLPLWLGARNRLFPRSPLSPGLSDPRVRRGRLPLGPSRRRRELLDRNGRHLIDDWERILGPVPGDAGDRIPIALVIFGADVDGPAGTSGRHAFELLDDRLVVGPAAPEPIRPLHRRPVRVHRRVGDFGAEVRVLAPLGVVPIHEGGVEGRA